MIAAQQIAQNSLHALHRSSEAAPRPGPVATTPRKKLVRRTARDYSQRLRLAFQLAFLALNGWMGLRFYYWVRWAETAGATREIARPAGVEGWLPIAGLMQLKYVVLTREVPRIHPAGFFLFTVVPADVIPSAQVILLLALSRWYGFRISLEARPLAFPPQFHSAALARHSAARPEIPAVRFLRLRGVQHVGRRYRPVPSHPLRPHRRRTHAELLPLPRRSRRIRSSSAWSSHPSLFRTSGAAISAPTGRSSDWRRWPALCASLAREPACIDCAKCAKACPAYLPVDKLIQIRSAECTGCLECVAVCPAKDALVIAAPRSPRHSRLVHGCRHRHHLLQPCRLCQTQRSLGHAASPTTVFSAGTSGQRAASPVARLPLSGLAIPQFFGPASSSPSLGCKLLLPPKSCRSLRSHGTHVQFKRNCHEKQNRSYGVVSTFSPCLPSP